MRIVQALLLLAGMPCLGATLGYYGLAALAASTQRPTPEPWQNGYGQYMTGLLLGVPLGALCGIASAVALMRARRWGRRVWFGAILGLSLGPFAAYWLDVDRGFAWYGVVVMIAACGAAGGLIGGAASGACDDPEDAKSGE